MTGAHVYTAGFQPAEDFLVDVSLDREPIRIKQPYWQKTRTHCCGVPRYRRWVQVQVYYDAVMFWCRPGKGCKA